MRTPSGNENIRLKMADEKVETDEKPNSSGDERDETDSKTNENSKQLQDTSAEIRIKSLDYYLVNGLRQVFCLLDAKSKGSLAKTQLQVICANICNVFKISFDADELAGYLKEKIELTFNEFVEYISKDLLPKVPDGKIDVEKFDRIAWTIVEKQRHSSQTKLFDDNELFLLWRSFNKVNIDESVAIDKEEAEILLQQFMQAMGTPWTKGPLDNFSEKNSLTFWNLVDCLESKYILHTSKSVYAEGLAAIRDFYVQEVIKKGSLVKKGHRIKSMKGRWFILTPNHLSYYESKSYRRKKGQIAINKQTKVEGMADGKNIKCRFVITCGETNTQYEMEAVDNKTKNEWITSIQSCIDLSESHTPLYTELRKRADERKQKRNRQAEEERQQLQQEELIRKQLQELELIRADRDKAKAQAESEAVLLEEERKRREELEALKAEYEKLLEEEKQAREAESLIRCKQQQILEDEMMKRRELEKIKAEQERVLEEERQKREGLEEASKEQAKALEEERQRLKTLDEAREAAESELSSAREKLQSAEEERRAAAAKVEAAKERARKMKMPVGLARPLALEQKGVTTHRGLGSFVDKDFSKTPLYLSSEQQPNAVNQREIPSGEERAQILETNLVKPSKGKAAFEN